MPDSGLRALVRLRRLAMAQARRDLAGCLQAEQRAAAALTAAEEAIERERRTALDLLADDGAVEAFAVWLPVGRQGSEQAGGALAEAAGRTGKSRAELAAARAALEAAEAVLQAREEAAARQADRLAQQALDELAQQSRGRSEREGHS